MQKVSKRAQQLQERIKVLEQERVVFLKSIAPINFKSKTVTCKGCGQRVPTNRFNGFQCPFCRAEFISPSNRERVNSYNSRIEKLKQDYLTAIHSKKPLFEKMRADVECDDVQHNGRSFGSRGDVPIDISVWAGDYEAEITFGGTKHAHGSEFKPWCVRFCREHGIVLAGELEVHAGDNSHWEVVGTVVDYKG